MDRAEAAQRGVLQAILDLHASGKLTSILTDLDNSVRPNFGALNLPIVAEPVFGIQPEPQASIGSYARSSRDRRQRLREFEDALEAWASRFRLTDDLAKAGKALPWVLDFARRACENGSFTIPPQPRAGKRTAPPWGLPIDGPNPNENFSDWVRRIRPALKAWYVLTRRQRQQRPYPDPPKRNQNHYRWFVLSLCGGLTPGTISRRLKIDGTHKSTILKGVTSVRKALGLPRK